jgi:drug/metabolite transporter, DME family
VLIGLAAVSWGTTGPVTAVLVATADATALVIGAVRMLVAAVLLAVLARWLVGSLRIAPADRRRCVGLGLCLAAFQATYFSAVTLIGVATAALIAICGAPLLIAALAAVMLGERVTARVAGALALGIAGTALLIVGPRTAADVSARFGAGALLALGAGLSYALYVVLAKATLARTAPLPLAAASFGVGALVLAPMLATPGVGHQLALGWPWLLYLGAVTTAGAYAIYTLGLRHVSASSAGVVALLEPLTATLLGVVFFGERLGAAGVLGAILLFAALGLLGARSAA